MNGLDTNKASGPDGISVRMLKGTAIFITQILMELYNLSITSGKVPSKWKISSVVPVPKSSANIDNPSNYRPISLLSVVCKIMERHIYSIVFEHLAERDLSLLHNGGFALGNSQLQFLCQLFMTFSNSWIMVLMSPLSFSTCVKHSTVFPIFHFCTS